MTQYVPTNDGTVEIDIRDRRSKELSRMLNDIKNSESKPRISGACESGDFKLVESLLLVPSTDVLEYGSAPLRYACWKEHYEIVELLVKIPVVKKSISRILHICLEIPYTNKIIDSDIIRLLLANGEISESYKTNLLTERFREHPQIKKLIRLLR